MQFCSMGSRTPASVGTPPWASYPPSWPPFSSPHSRACVARRVWRRGGGELLLQIEPWYLCPVPTYRVNKHEDRGDITQQTADTGGRKMSMYVGDEFLLGLQEQGAASRGRGSSWVREGVLLQIETVSWAGKPESRRCVCYSISFSCAQ
jgi:hypothetical protein